MKNLLFHLFQTPPSGPLQMCNLGWFIAYDPWKAVPLVSLVCVLPFEIFGTWMDALCAPYQRKNFDFEIPSMATNSLRVWNCGRFFNGMETTPATTTWLWTTTCFTVLAMNLIWLQLLESRGEEVITSITCLEDHHQPRYVQTWWMTSSCFRKRPSHMKIICLQTLPIHHLWERCQNTVMTVNIYTNIVSTVVVVVPLDLN